MPIPDFQTAMRPALVAIDNDKPKSKAQISDSAAAAMGVTDQERLPVIPNGRQELFINRVAWALTHTTRAGLLTHPQRGRYLFTKRGRKVVQEHPDRVDVAVLAFDDIDRHKVTTVLGKESAQAMEARR